MQVWDYVHGCVGRLLDAASEVAASDAVEIETIEQVAEHTRKAVALCQHRMALMSGELRAEIARIEQTLEQVGKRQGSLA